MSLTTGELHAAADLIHAAHLNRVPIAPLTARYPALSVDDAYAIQKINLDRRLHLGHAVVGHKIGLTSEPMQALLGVDEPDFGYILDDMVFPDGGAVSADRFCAPRVEPEIAFLLHTALRGPTVTADDVRAATQAVAVALEIVDSRVADWQIALPDTVADNASSGAVVLGEWVPFSAALDLPNARASLRLNDIEIDTGLGSAVLGDPAVAVAWLANALAPYDIEITPGQFVMSGSFTSAAFVHRGDRADATITGLGTVSLHLD
ncbi:2-keto-4-pentenoate hydratase [Mycolicibacterium aubagnense]|uniref:2-keto-4-pentenoate hydratase n=1 Tax=Mycolicibacterium aubagnense TaxID=319707 RepID=A0ABM7IJ96_9MYCO|nr:fumarylacetoacetate hydrolase family protein [Mycolicibacterium aubagnense]TLH66757.1 2-keto-4-pentenoate hydratase [Mycolicibacterium aubagnense]WGI31651.1 fumarylacetoacetate hydrolase family protein [Mycolicibacterium aubagnense]BBX86870.1 2-keto-4-pentenoate hydratase [Mycolicibacterium aubagnense]